MMRIGDDGEAGQASGRPGRGRTRRGRACTKARITEVASHRGCVNTYEMKTSGGQNLWTCMGIKGSGAAGSGHIWESQVVEPQVVDTYGDRRLWGHRLWTHMGIKTSGGQNLWGGQNLCVPPP